MADGVIRRIDRASVHRICANQVVFDLATAVKELIENALDVNATRIDVRLRNFGVDCIEVADNGPGIAPQNFEGLTLKHWTSKLESFSDLDALRSFGFRGEALSSLCAMSELSVATRRSTDEMATSLVYDHDGKLLKQSSCARFCILLCVVHYIGPVTHLNSFCPLQRARHHGHIGVVVQNRPRSTQGIRKALAPRILPMSRAAAGLCAGVARCQIHGTFSFRLQSPPCTQHYELLTLH
jgi:hypothetical protein